MKPAATWGVSANQHGKGSMADDLTYVPAPKLDKSTDFTKALQDPGNAGGPVLQGV